MSETTTPSTEAATEAPEAPKPAPPPSAPKQTTEAGETPNPERLPDDHPLVKAYHATRAELRTLREQREAADPTERLTQLEQQVTQAEARVLRREVALDPAGDGSVPALSKDDAALLDTITDEAAMRSLAQRLAKVATDTHTGNIAPGEGSNPRPKPDEKRSFVRQLTGQG